MTQKQIEARKNAIYFSVYKGGVRIGKTDEFTESQNRELEELACRDMVNSILIYHYEPTQKRIAFPKGNRYLHSYIVTLGLDLTKKLWKEQVKDFRKTMVGNAGSDSEGCTYKCCKCADD